MGMDRLRLTLVVFATLSISSGLVGCGGHFNPSSNLATCRPPVDCTPGHGFLYATSPGEILGFTIDPTTGALSSPTSITGPNQSSGMTTPSSGTRLLYVSDFQNDAVLGFTADMNSGALTAISGSPFSLGGTSPGAGGLSLAGGNSGPFSYLYVTDLNAATVAGFSLDLSGTLTAFPGSPFPAGNTPVQVVQAGYQDQFLYVSNLNDPAGGISAYNIDPTGALTPIPGSPFPTGPAGSFPGPSAMVQTGNFLYVALSGTVSGNNQIVAFSIDQNTGVLGAIPGSPFTTGKDPLYMVTSASAVFNQFFLYTANVQDNSISAFIADDTTGLLTEMSGSPYSGAIGLAGLAVTSNGKPFLYAADQAGSILGYAINTTTGELQVTSGSPFSTAGSPTLLTIINP